MRKARRPIRGPGPGPRGCSASPRRRPDVAGQTTSRFGYKNFDKITGGGLKEGDAPDTIGLPEELTEDMQQAWDGSLPGGKSQEQGGNLVREKDGGLAVALASSDQQRATCSPRGGPGTR